MTAHWFGPQDSGGSSKGSGHPVMFGKPQPAQHFDPMPDGGGYPQGFLEWAFGLMGVGDSWDEVLHICSGSVRTGIRVDVRAAMQPSVVADGRHLPFAAGSFRWVLADPPYSEDYASNLYGTGEHYPSPGSLLAEAGRVCAPGGWVGFMHFQVPMFRRPLRLVQPYGITQGCGYAIRAWSLFRKDPEVAQLSLDGDAA